MKDYIIVSTEINGTMQKIRFVKRDLLRDFEGAQIFTNMHNPDYQLTIRYFIRWKIVKGIYKAPAYKELREISDSRLKNDIKILTDWLKAEKLEKQLFIGKVSEIIGFDKTNELLKEAKEAIQKLPK
jgi:hypothetical protein